MTTERRRVGPASHAPALKAGRILGAVLVAIWIAGGLAMAPRAAAQEASPSSFASQAAAIDYYLALQSVARQTIGSSRFPSQAAAIDYYVALQSASRQSIGASRFPSQAAAIDYYLALHSASRQSIDASRFPSEAAAIDYYVALQFARTRGSVCSYSPEVLGGSFKPAYFRLLTSC